MNAFLPDTNVWIDVGRDARLTSRLEEVLIAGSTILVAPPALIELVRGLVRHGNETFSEDKQTYLWMKDHRCEVLELTKPFMAKMLNTTYTRNSGVIPKHYEELIDMIVSSANLDEFIKRCKATGSVWNDVESLDRIHEAQIEKELQSLEELASRGINIAEVFSRMFGTPDCRPDPLIIARQFSAFIEYVETSFRKVALQGANPRKNDRGMYVDWQLLAYLAREDIQFLTNENFAGEITKSPQKDRIIKPSGIA